MNLVVTNEIPDGRCRHHDFERDHAALAIGTRQQRLADDALEDERELRPDLRLLVGRENVDDAVDRLRGRICVEGAERQMSGLRDFQCCFHRFEVAHLSNQDDVGILAQCRTQRGREAARVTVHLSLVDETALVLMDVLDRILDGENVLVALRVDLVEHGRKRRRLAAAGWPRHEHQPPRAIGERGKHRRQPQLAEGLDRLWNQAVDGADGTALIEHVAAEPRADGFDAERKVQLQRLLKSFLLRVGEDAVHELLGVRRRHLGQRQARELAMHPNLRRRTGGDVEIRAFHLHERLE